VKKAKKRKNTLWLLTHVEMPKVSKVEGNCKRREAIAKQKADYYRANRETIAKKRVDYYRANRKQILKQTRTRNASTTVRDKIKMRRADRYRTNASAIADKYHKQKNLKQVISDYPGSRKTMSRAVIKKQILGKLKLGKNLIKVRNSNGDWIKVRGPRFFRVYIATNNAKRIKQESIVPFYGSKAWLVQVSTMVIFEQTEAAILLRFE